MANIPENLKAFVQQQLRPLQAELTGIKERVVVLEDRSVAREGPSLTYELCAAFVASKRPACQQAFRHITKNSLFSSTEAAMPSWHLSYFNNKQSVYTEADLEHVREARNSAAHIASPEELVLAIKKFKDDGLMLPLQRLGDPLIFDLLDGSSELVNRVIGPARVLQLSALLLRMAKSQLYHGNYDWSWVAWVYKDKGVKAFAQGLVDKVPELGANPLDFALGADDIETRACAVGPCMPALSSAAVPDPTFRTINLSQLQAAVQRCNQGGMLNDNVRVQEKLACHMLDVLPGHLV